MLCYHHKDLDGYCSAAIVLKKYPMCKLRPIDYNDNPIFKDEVKNDEQIIILGGLI